MNKDMKVYTKYSFFVENTLGLGRNGKRLAHGGLAAAGTWAAGTYGGVEYINANMPQALVVAGVAGVGVTVLADYALLDDHEEALMALEKLRVAEGSNPEMAKIVASNAAEISELRDGQKKKDDAPSQKSPSVIRRVG